MPSNAGYSGTPLARKLGISDGDLVVTLNAPEGYRGMLAPLPAGSKVTSRIPRDARLVHVFSTSRKDLARQLRRLRGQIAQDGVVWVS